METTLSMSVRAYVPDVNWVEKTHPKYKQHQSIVHGSGLNQKEKSRQEAAFTSPCFLTVDALSGVASHSWHHAFPTAMHWTSKL